MKPSDPPPPAAGPSTPARPARAPLVCPVCGAIPQEIKAKLVCLRCHTILETCCEGGAQDGGACRG